MKIKWWGLLILVALLWPNQVFAQSERVRTGELVVVAEEEVIESNYIIMSGERVEILGRVEGDVYAAGGKVLIDGVVTGDVMVAGGQVIVSGRVDQDLRLVGGQVNVSGRVGGNTTIAGGNIALDRAGNLEGSLIVMGGNVDVLAPVGSDLLAAAGSVTVSAPVGGRLDAYVGNLRLTEQAQIEGNFSFNQDAEMEIDEAASISGGRESRSGLGINQMEKEAEKAADAVKALRFGWMLASFVSALVVGVIMIHNCQRYAKAAAEIVGKKPGVSMAIGLVALILTLIVIAALMMSVIGIPLALLALLVYLLYIYLAKIYVAIFVGKMVVDKLGFEVSQVASFFIGLVIIYALMLLPMAGPLLGFGVLILGLGASIQNDQNYFRTFKTKKLI